MADLLKVQPREIYEKNISATQIAPQERARLPQADENQGGKKGAQAPETKGETQISVVTETLGGLRVKPNGFPKNKIIKSRIKMAEIVKTGNRKEGELLTIFVKSEKDEPAFAFLVDKNLKRATERNRLKRITRELVRTGQNALRRTSAIIMIKPAAENQTFWQVKVDFDNLISIPSRA
jgi:ribonuclease P protein component